MIFFNRISRTQNGLQEPENGLSFPGVCMIFRPSRVLYFIMYVHLTYSVCFLLSVCFMYIYLFIVLCWIWNQPTNVCMYYKNTDYHILCLVFIREAQLTVKQIYQHEWMWQTGKYVFEVHKCMRPFDRQRVYGIIIEIMELFFVP